MSRMRRIAGVGLGALALSAVVLSGNAWASTLTSSPVTYATQAVAGSAGGGTIQIPAGAMIKYTTTASTAATVTAGNFTVVFTLPTGVTASGTVTATVTDSGGANCTPTTTLAGTVSSNTITFMVPTLAGGAAAGTCSVTLNAFTISGATSLQTPTTSTPASGFLIMAQMTATTGNAFVVDAAPLKTALASSANGLTTAGTTVTGPVTNVDTNVGPGGATQNGQAAPGKVFCTVCAPPVTDQLLDQLGTVLINSNGGTFAANGTTPFSFGTGTTATLTLTGNYSGITSIFFDPTGGGGACQTTAAKEAAVSGVNTGTISGSTATFSGIIFSATPGLVCEYAGGTSLIGVNPSGVSATVTVPASTGIAATTVTFTTPIGPSVYVPGTPYFVSYTGNFSSYPTFLRIVNNAAAPVMVYADVQGDLGVAGGAIVESGLPPFDNDLVSVATIISNAGLSLGNNRASLIVFASPAAAVANAGAAAFGPGSVVISHLMVNPDGTIVQLGGNNNP